MEVQATDAHGEPDGTWTFITNHAGALLLVSRDPDIRLAELAERLEVTERAAQRIVHDLVDGGYLSVVKRGRRNHYQVLPQSTMRHPSVRSVGLRRLLELLGPQQDASPAHGEAPDIGPGT